MTEPNRNSPKSLLWLFVLQATFVISMILDIPFVRQVFGFILLTFIPGFLILRIIGVEKNNIFNSILFSVGLSIAFLMLIGMLLNALGMIGLLTAPLSTDNIGISINLVLVLLILFGSLKGKNLNFKMLWTTKYLYIFPYLLIPILSIFGIIFAKVTGSNIILMFSIVVFSVIFLFGIFSSRLSSHLPLILVMIAAALLLSTTLMSGYIYGDDIGLEYSVFRETQALSFQNWQSGSSIDDLAYKSMASVTILPTIFSNLLAIEGIWVFKIIFPLIFALMPLGLYQIYRSQWDKKTAFIGAFLFIASYEFSYVMPSLAKQMIAEFFFVLLFLILLTPNFKDYAKSKWIIIAILIFGLVVSHYSTNYIFLFLLFAFWLCERIFFVKSIKRISTSIVAFSFSITFLWYLYIARGATEKFAGLIEGTLSSLISEFGILSSRDILVQQAFGIIDKSTVMHDAGRAIFNLVTILIFIGFISLSIKWKRRIFDSRYALIAYISMFLLLTSILLPRFVAHLGMSRMYHIGLIFLSPLFALGIQSIISGLFHFTKRNKTMNLSRENRKRIYYLGAVSIILINFFFFQVGFVYEVTKDPEPSSIYLSFARMQNSTDLIHENDVYSASWLSKYGNITKIYTWADRVSFDHVLLSYSTISRSMIFLLSNTTTKWIAYGTFRSEVPEDTNTSYVYLRQYNVITGKIAWDVPKNVNYNISENPVLNSSDSFINKIYSNGGSQIRYLSPK